MCCWKQSLAQAIRLLGSQAKLARAIGCSPSKISALTLADKPVRAEDALAIERATGGAVKAATLRPDIWEQTTDAAPPTRYSLLLEKAPDTVKRAGVFFDRN